MNFLFLYDIRLVRGDKFTFVTKKWIKTSLQKLQLKL